MKKIYIFNLIILALCFNFSVTAQPEWSVVGNAGFSSGRADNLSLAFSPNGEPYVAYAPFGNTGKISVNKFSSGTWSIAGNPDFSAGYAEDISLAFNPVSGEPYVAFMDYGNSYKATVMKLAHGSNTWVNVGPAGFTTSTAAHTSLAFSSSGEPYVAFSDMSLGNKATVMKFSNNHWVFAGTPGFTAGMAEYTCIAFDPSNNTPYIAFQDHNQPPAKVTVMKLINNIWVNAGSPGFSQHEVFELSLAFNPVSHEPYLAYIDHPAQTL